MHAVAISRDGRMRQVVLAMSDPIKAALETASKRLCICNNECFAVEARRGRAHGPCERRTRDVADAIAAFLRSPDIWEEIMLDYEAVTEAIEHISNE